MIFPYRTKLDEECNIVFIGHHIPSGKKEVIDRIFKFWETELTYDPVTKNFLETSCSCPDCQINRAKGDDGYICKHIMEDLNYLNLIL